jgi:hypothetical protein
MDLLKFIEQLYEKEVLDGFSIRIERLTARHGAPSFCNLDKITFHPKSKPSAISKNKEVREITLSYHTRRYPVGYGGRMKWHVQEGGYWVLGVESAKMMLHLNGNFVTVRVCRYSNLGIHDAL